MRNDAHLENFENELRSKKNSDTKVRSEPTSVTILNILGGKKLRKITYEGLRVLLDTGCSDSLVRAEYAKSGKEKKSKNIYTTGGGEITTHTQSTIFFTLPEFSDKKIIKWDFNVFDDKHLEYDLIIGRDLMSELKLDILFSQSKVSWEGIEIPMIDFNKLKKYKLNKKEFKAFIHNTSEPVVTEAATKRVVKILDASYEAADLKKGGRESYAPKTR